VLQVDTTHVFEGTTLIAVLPPTPTLAYKLDLYATVIAARNAGKRKCIHCGIVRACSDTSNELADYLGYHRYWVAEHHGGPMLAGPSPEALIGPIAAPTSRIRADPC
jgi:hypothetical protein